MRTSVERSPREENREADALANGDCADFNPEWRISVSASDLFWEVPQQLWLQDDTTTTTSPPCIEVHDTSEG